MRSGFCPKGLDPSARITLAVFTATLLAWTFTKVSETRSALIAVGLLTVAGALSVTDVASVTFSKTTLLLASAFVLAAATRATGLSERATLAVTSRARTVNGLFWQLAGVAALTVFIVPSTSGRAALLLPSYRALCGHIESERIRRALSLLFPTVVLLTAAAFLLGAGAHLVTTELLTSFGGSEVGLLRWSLLAVPFAAVSAGIATYIIIAVFTTPEERRQRLTIADRHQPRQWTQSQRRMACLLTAAMFMWATSTLHGVHPAWVAAAAAALSLLPGSGLGGWRAGVGAIKWDLLVLLASTVALAKALTQTGAATWLTSTVFAPILSNATPDWLVVSAVAVVSLLAHLVISSRTARASVLIPVVVLVAAAADLDLTALGFLSTMAAGYCLTLPHSAKPVMLFSREDGAYQPTDLIRLSRWLIPAHLGLLLGFSFAVWPALGLPLSTAAAAETPGLRGGSHLPWTESEFTEPAPLGIRWDNTDLRATVSDDPGNAGQHLDPGMAEDDLEPDDAEGSDNPTDDSEDLEEWDDPDQNEDGDPRRTDEGDEDDGGSDDHDPDQGAQSQEESSEGSEGIEIDDPDDPDPGDRDESDEPIGGSSRPDSDQAVRLDDEDGEDENDPDN